MICHLMTAMLRLFCGCHARLRTPLDGDRPRVFFANHASHLDVLFLWASLPGVCRQSCRMVGARDYWEAGPIRRWIARRVFDAVLIERKHVTKSNNPLTTLKACLKEEQSLIIFPEGTRGEGGEVNVFQPGIWHLARAFPQVDFVPVWIENLSRVLPKGEILPIPLIAAATFGEPIRLEQGEGKKAFLKRARDAVVSLQTEHADASQASSQVREEAPSS